MTTDRNDDAATSREDSYLARLVPQAMEHLAEHEAAGFDAEAGRSRFHAWLTEHSEDHLASGRDRERAEESATIADTSDGPSGINLDEPTNHDPDAIVAPMSWPKDLAAPEVHGTGPAGESLVREHQPSAVAPDEIKIGMWGAPTSGKTTYLAALRHAVDTDRTNGRWVIYPGNESSAKFMVQHTHNLLANHRFPEATLPGAEDEVSWHLIGDLAGSRFDRRKLRRRGPLPSQFALNVADVSGEAFGPTETARLPLHIFSRALDHLASAQGLLYFFDPVSDRKRSDAMQYLNRVIVALSHRMLAEDRLVNGYLPHQVSVCITKFDHPDIFRRVWEAGLVSVSPDGRPQVLDKDAETLFNMICDGSFWDRYEVEPTSAGFVRDELRRRFHPDRIRYFVTSAIGFRQTATKRAFDPLDYANFLPTEGGPKIIGPVAPVNVLEPLLSLQRRISGTSRIRRLHVVRPGDAEGDWRRRA